MALARPLGLGRREAVFFGWFGPIGVSAVFYLAHALHEGFVDDRLFAAGTLPVAASVVAFGFTASPGRKAYAGRDVTATGDEGTGNDVSARSEVR